MEWLVSAPVTNLGATGLLVVTVLLILTGRLQPRSNSKLWQEAYFKERDGREVRDRQISELIEANRVAVRALDEIPKAAKRTGGDHAPTTEGTAAEDAPGA